jgi:DNA polymerase V
MIALDAVNARWGRNMLRPASAGFERQRGRWDTKFETRSRRYTTRLDGVMCVIAR